MTTAVLVMAGAALGAVCRWALGHAVQARVGGAFPWGTLVVNVVGSLVLGVLLAAAVVGTAGATLVALAGVGFAGAFTTYSTFAVETVQLVLTGARGRALANAGVSLAAGTGAAVVGWTLGFVALG
ncbi:MAG: fluoride efflux transporter FluC [Kineosporiaceae bacterium]